MSSGIPHLSVTEAARGADERKSLKSLNRPIGTKVIPFDMVSRRHSVLSCRCSYDHRLGVLGVAKITMSMRMLCVCVWRTCLYKCVCVCV